MSEMKNILMSILMCFSLFVSEAEETREYRIGDFSKISVVSIEGHEYCLFFAYKGGGICHSESCPCKSNVVSNAKNTQGPRLFPKNMRLRKYEEQKGICKHCTNHFEFVEMQGDHIIPYSKGGKTEYSNLQMLCIPCNRKKSNKYNY